VLTLANAYMESIQTKRLARTTDMLTTMAHTVVASAFSSVCASLILLSCSIESFKKFGILMCLACLASICWSLTFFVSLCFLWGPEHDDHQICGANPKESAKEDIQFSEICGFLKKRGAKNVAWKRRYFVLQDYRLRYYTNPAQDYEKGSIDLRTQFKINVHGGENEFQIWTEHRTYYLRADNARDKGKWVETLEYLRMVNTIQFSYLETEEWFFQKKIPDQIGKEFILYSMEEMMDLTQDELSSICGKGAGHKMYSLLAVERTDRFYLPKQRTIESINSHNSTKHKKRYSSKNFRNTLQTTDNDDPNEEKQSNLTRHKKYRVRKKSLKSKKRKKSWNGCCSR